LSLLLVGVSSEASLAQQGPPQGRYGEALKHWKTTLDTAEGDERAALGLAGVAIKAGARSVMASLWSVNDASTAKLVPLFFENLKKPNLSKAQALQRAQQHLLADVEYQHPFYWAGFVLIGNWL
jgi:CHAT domain-containing protein